MNRRVLALLLVILSLALVASFWRPIWLLLAYRSSTAISHSNSSHELEIYRKRASWLPGERVWFPVQDCAACRDGRHGVCLELFVRKFERMGQVEPVLVFDDLEVQMGWRCSCVNGHPER